MITKCYHDVINNIFMVQSPQYCDCCDSEIKSVGIYIIGWTDKYHDSYIFCPNCKNVLRDKMPELLIFDYRIIRNVLVVDIIPEYAKFVVDRPDTKYSNADTIGSLPLDCKIVDHTRLAFRIPSIEGASVGMLVEEEKQDTKLIDFYVTKKELSDSELNNFLESHANAEPLIGDELVKIKKIENKK